MLAFPAVPAYSLFSVVKKAFIWRLSLPYARGEPQRLLSILQIGPGTGFIWFRPAYYFPI